MITRIFFLSVLVSLLPLSIFVTYATESSVQELRSGALVCDVDRKTGRRMVWLPAIWEELTEGTAIHRGGIELVYLPAQFEVDGTLLQPARVIEKVIRHEPKYETRQIILARARIGYLTQAGELYDLNTIPIDEGVVMSRVKQNVLSGIKTHTFDWDMVFKAYVKDQNALRVSMLKSIRRNGNHATIPRVVTPNIDWVSDTSELKVGADVPVSILIEPAIIKLQTKEEVVAGWEKFARRRAEKLPKTYECDGKNLISKKDDSERFPVKTFEDIGVMVPIYVSRPRVRMYNIYGEEIR